MSKIEWTPQQKAVFADFASGRGNTAVIARAGSGKTTTIVEGLNYIPSRHRKVCFAAFNKKIAAEIKARVPEGIEVKTVHSMGFGALRQAAKNVVVVEDKTIHIANAVLLGKTPTADIIPTEKEGPRPRFVKGAAALSKLVGFAKNMLLEDAASIADVAIDRELDKDIDADTLGDYAIDVLDACGAITSIIDYDDMVWLPWLYQLKPFGFDMLVGDEVQDWNAASLYIIGSAIRASGRLIGVGDDYQSIYQFRGADALAIPNLIQHFEAKTLPLTVTYRCPKAVVDLAKKIVPDLEAAPNAIEGLVDVCGLSEVARRAQPGDFILSRRNAPLMGLCVRLVRQGTPACIAGRDVGKSIVEMIDRSQAQTVVDLLKWSKEIKDEDVKRYTAIGAEERVAQALDRHELLVAAAEGAHTIDAIHSRVNMFFRDEDDDRKVVCSTIHKAKGLERDNVFLLEKTFTRDGSTEDRNLRYVGITRAKKCLTLVN